MSLPTISIIIPVYNHAEALKQAIASVFEQTYRPIEVNVVDDGSDKEFQISDFRFQNVQLIRQGHSGAPAARNRGLCESKGEYVIFWDADVIAKPEMLAKLKQTLDEHSEASYAYPNFYFGRKKMAARPFDAKALRERNYISSLALIRRDAVIPWDETLKRFQDWDLWLTMLEKGRTGVWVPEFLARAIPRKGGMSAWLPSFAYRFPWRVLPGICARVAEYERDREIVLRKHGKV